MFCLLQKPVKTMVSHLLSCFKEIISQKGVFSMADVLGMVIPKDEQEEIKEFVSTLLLLPREDRAILLSNANAFKVRRDIERARK